MAVSAWPVAHALATYLAHNLMKIFPAASLTAEDIAGMFTDPPNPEMGDYAFPCFPLAKTLHQAPPAIAQKIASSLPADELIAAVQNAGPYVNFTISPASLGKLVVQPILHGDFLQGKFVTPQRIMVEYSQPNTHKVLHVGHMRNLCLGNALVRILRYAGHEVIAATYPGDVGAHVAKCLWYLKNYNQEPIPATERGAWLGKIYTSATRLLDAHKEAGTDGEDKKIITQILNELSSGKGAYYDLWQETRAWSLELFQEAYQWAEIEFDHWYFESQFDASSLALAKKYYAEGKYILSENAIGMDLSEEKLGFCMMIKSDGTGMYATKDIDLGQKKFADFALDRSIYVVDKRQAFHFKQIFATLKKLGFKHADDCYHLEYEFVELPSGPMSSRAGNIIPLMDLVATLEKTIKENYLKRYQDTWPAEEIERTARLIANGAIKFGMCRLDNQRKIVFDMDAWAKLDGETGPYLQYVYARIASLAQKVGPLAGEIDFAALTLPAEKKLLAKLAHFNQVVAMCAAQLKPSFLCAYLFDLGKIYNAFYTDCPILKAEPTVQQARFALSLATQKVIGQGLELLGIHGPPRM